MTLDRWIAVISSFAAMVSAILAAGGIYQAIKQRRSSYRPQIIPKNFIFNGSKNSDNKFSINILEVNSNNIYEISVINPGLGAAVNIEYSWQFEYHDFINYLHNKLASIHSPNEMDNPESYGFKYNIEETKEKIEFRTRSNFRLNPHIIPKTPTLIQCFLPYSVEKDTSKLQLPSFSLVLITNDLLINKPDDYPAVLANGPVLKLKYQDIGGKNLVEYFETKIEILNTYHMFDTVEFFAQLSFNKVSVSKTTAILRSIRKSYAEFIRTHDFNKNS
ncbi:TPA: hypothetical protein ACJIK4_003517 [Kluyvera cryocrescens]